MHSAWISISQDLWPQVIETCINRKECMEGLQFSASNGGKVRHVIGKNRNQGSFKGLGGRKEQSFHQNEETSIFKSFFLSF